MATFTVWKFDDPVAADGAAAILRSAASDGLITVIDHAVVSWPVGQATPTTKHSHDDQKRGTGWGAFWGLLLGVLFFMPILGAAAGAAIGAISKTTAAVGIGRTQLETIREQVTTGTSALFAVTEDGDTDRVGERFHGMHATLIATNLTDAERAALLETFGA
ncbi:DUF1269 domain-containing protein [Krasilnikoviella flava]|uniref:Uncharacterized membrane protein n=1 Tax=Krasilnikoviella flava TaxID=526729 RepID=A0A1T5KEK4_9MICO|nr:DUF1269 domain-containing protein [Krasilnikoviella flava]SKC62136.1 Uncharacterized membrane protein [Krasilnikoviella flava]